MPAANMLCCSLRHHGTEILDRGSGVGAYARRGATMGIPLLHPWANRLAGFDYEAAGKRVRLRRGAGLVPTDEAGLPIHGVLPALMRWDVDDRQPDALAAVLCWKSPRLLELFPFEHQLRIEIQVGNAELRIATTLYATGEDSVPVCFGYHPYLRIPDAPREAWRVTLGAFRRLVLDDNMIPTGEREPVGRRRLYLDGASLDDGFDALAVPAEFEAAAGSVALTVRFVEGFSYAQVYAPRGKDFVCFEPMTAPANALRSGDGLRIVSPGELHRTVFTISIARARNVRSHLSRVAGWELVVLAIAGCGAVQRSGGCAARSRQRHARLTRRSPRVGQAAVVRVARTAYGRALTDRRGFALYLFTHDRSADSTCYGACAAAWPPYVVAERPTGTARGAYGRLLGSVRRRDGRLQVTYAGHPLYHYVGDRRPEQVLCQAVPEFGGTWYVVAPSGNAIH